MRGGFTTVELMVAVGLMVVLIGSIVSVFSRSTEVFQRAVGLTEIAQNSRAALEILGREIAGSRPLLSNEQQFVIHNPRD